MPQVATGLVARPTSGGVMLGHVDRFVQALASSIELTRDSETERAIHWLLVGVVVCGAIIVRFWGLGAVGLHGDEETMAMAVRGILEQGAPVLPSGMFYPRGMTQLGLMSLSVWLFGESEWALRVPSALCGVALVLIGYFVGRRFLRPYWSIALAAALAFIPELIVYSQTGRMYIFLVTFIAASMACLFAWERSGRAGWLIGAIVALIFGLEMHSLAIACVLMLLFPGAVHGDYRKVGVGVLAMIAVVVGYVLIEIFVGAQYPEPPADFAADAGVSAAIGPKVVPQLSVFVQIMLWAMGIVLAWIAVRLVKVAGVSRDILLPSVFLLAGIGLQLALFYHAAALCYAVGFVAIIRDGALRERKSLLLLVFGVVAIALSHAALLAPSAGTLIRLVGAITGQPSVWPYVRIAEFSVAAGLLCGVFLLWGLVRLALGKRVPDAWLLVLVGVWCPVFALGLFAWDVPSRYTAMSLMPMLVGALVLAQTAADFLRARSSHAASKSARFDGACAAVAALCVVNPVAVAETIDAGYQHHPDHKGAAEFMRSQGATAEDVILAEDILQQTYYLGDIDYWLIGPSVARRFVMKSDTGVVDFYTGTPVIVTTAMLDKVLRDNRDKRIFIIGTGEEWRDGRRRVRGELEAAIESERFETVYLGRDGLTRVLRAVPSAAPAPSVTSEAESRKNLAESAEVAIEKAGAADDAHR